MNDMIYSHLIAIARSEQVTNQLLDDIAIDEAHLLKRLNAIKMRKQQVQTDHDEIVRLFKEKLLAMDHDELEAVMEANPEITFRRASRWQYDDDEALAWALDHAPECVKHTLKKREFNKIADQTVFAEKVNIPEIVLGKLGHLIIREEFESNDKRD